MKTAWLGWGLTVGLGAVVIWQGFQLARLEGSLQQQLRHGPLR